MRRGGMPEKHIKTMAIVGDPDSVAEQAAAFADAGIEGLTLTVPDVYDLETVALAGRTLRPIFEART